MSTSILDAKILPNAWLSLQVKVQGPPPTRFGVEVNGVFHAVSLVPEIGFEQFAGAFFLPRITQVRETSTVIAYPIDADLEPIGLPSAPVTVSPAVYAPETNLRQMVADSIDSAEIAYNGEQVWVARDRMGRAVTLSGALGRRGPIVEVGVTYMSSEEPFANSTDTDTDIVVPVKVIVKGDNVDRGQDAVDIAYFVRGELTERLQVLGYGITSWRWSGGSPEPLQAAYAVSMQMTLTRFSDQGVCES